MKTLIAWGGALAALFVAADAAAQVGQGYGGQPPGVAAGAPLCPPSGDAGGSGNPANCIAAATGTTAGYGGAMAPPAPGVAVVPAGPVKARKRLNKRKRPCFNDCG